MIFTTRFWVSPVVLLCSLLFQSCQSNSLSATKEEELAASFSSYALTVNQRVLSELSAVQSLVLFKEDYATLPSARALIPSVFSTLLASAGNPLEDSKPLDKRKF